MKRFNKKDEENFKNDQNIILKKKLRDETSSRWKMTSKLRTTLKMKMIEKMKTKFKDDKWRWPQNDSGLKNEDKPNTKRTIKDVKPENKDETRKKNSHINGRIFFPAYNYATPPLFWFPLTKIVVEGHNMKDAISEIPPNLLLYMISSSSLAKWCGSITVSWPVGWVEII